MSDRTSENSFVCTTSSLQTDDLVIRLSVQDGINLGSTNDSQKNIFNGFLFANITIIINF